MLDKELFDSDLTEEGVVFMATLYEKFEQTVKDQCSWNKWGIMNLYHVDYRVAERVLLEAVEKGLVKPEDYYHRFVVIKQEK